MTNNQALLVSNYCGILYDSKQITFGVANRLAKNSKFYNKIQEEVSEIKKRGIEREEKEEAIIEELHAFGQAQFEENFQTIDLALIENLAYEELPVVVSRGEDKVQENWKISDMLIVLQELEIIK